MPHSIYIFYFYMYFIFFLVILIHLSTCSMCIAMSTAMCRQTATLCLKLTHIDSLVTCYYFHNQLSTKSIFFFFFKVKILRFCDSKLNLFGLRQNKTFEDDILSFLETLMSLLFSWFTYQSCD